MTTARLVALLSLLFFPDAAFAYIDPGAGMLLLQAVIAAIGAALIFVRRPFDWIARKLKSLRRPDAGP